MFLDQRTANRIFRLKLPMFRSMVNRDQRAGLPRMAMIVCLGGSDCGRSRLILLNLHFFSQSIHIVNHVVYECIVAELSVTFKGAKRETLTRRKAPKSNPLPNRPTGMWPEREKRSCFLQ